MGTWGIAKDMAKINEENLSKLSRKGMFQKMKDYGSNSSKKIYTFKKATPELLASIQLKRSEENVQLRRKNITIMMICVLIGFITLLSIYMSIL